MILRHPFKILICGLLLNYIFGMREAGRPLIEFDIFDVENYDAIIERIEAQETERE